MTQLDRGLASAWWALRIGLGAGAFLAGLDKYFNLLAHWEMYLNPAAAALSPVSPAVLMRAVGVVEMAVGLAILTRWTREGAYVAGAWPLAIAVNLVAMGSFFDIAVRDVEMALGAYTLARLTEARVSALTRRRPEEVRRPSAA